MFRWIFICYFIYEANCQLLPIIYAAPSAVSHQSRIDVKSSPGIIATPFVYSPAVYATYPGKLDNSDTVYKPVLSDGVLTPIALSFFHNLPLARALESPVYIQQEDSDNESKERYIEGTNITSAPDVDKENIK